MRPNLRVSTTPTPPPHAPNTRPACAVPFLSRDIDFSSVACQPPCRLLRDTMLAPPPQSESDLVVLPTPAPGRASSPRAFDAAPSAGARHDMQYPRLYAVPPHVPSCPPPARSRSLDVHPTHRPGCACGAHKPSGTFVRRAPRVGGGPASHFPRPVRSRAPLDPRRATLPPGAHGQIKWRQVL